MFVVKMLMSLVLVASQKDEVLLRRMEAGGDTGRRLVLPDCKTMVKSMSCNRDCSSGWTHFWTMKCCPLRGCSGTRKLCKKKVCDYSTTQSLADVWIDNNDYGSSQMTIDGTTG